jgi:hypothetical protein
MKTTYQSICVNDWIKGSGEIYQVVARRSFAGAVLLELDRDLSSGKNFLYGFPNSEIDRLTLNQIGHLLIDLQEAKNGTVQIIGQNNEAVY